VKDLLKASLDGGTDRFFSLQNQSHARKDGRRPRREETEMKVIKEKKKTDRIRRKTDFEKGMAEWDGDFKITVCREKTVPRI
jgi:hypothetical protein